MTASSSQSKATTLKLDRLMRPSDANSMGLIHGGILLTLIEEAGSILSTRHCNNQDEQNRCWGALVRVENADFLQPVYIGEVVHIDAVISYTSEHSVEVNSHIHAENIITGVTRLVHKSVFWYVPCSLQVSSKIIEVPPIEYSSVSEEQEGRKRYEHQHTHRLETQQKVEQLIIPSENPERQTVGHTLSRLIHLVGPTDCMFLDFMHGGAIMKLMDEVGGIVAARHANSKVVTGSMDSINFYHKVRNGSLLTVTGWLNFVSSRSMEVQVIVDACSLTEKPFRAASAYINMIAIGKDNKPQCVPPLKVEGADESKRFEEGKERYTHNKAARLRDKERSH